jgi:O-glycosyl hydrolase
MHKGAKRMWALGNYSRFVREGYVRVGASINNENLLVSAYQSPEAGETVLVVVNPVGERQPLGVEMFDSGITEVYITDEYNDCVNLYETLDGLWNYTVPGRSVITFIYKPSN